MSSIPTDVVAGIVKGLGEGAAAIAQLFAAAGYDLGPMTPDARKDFAAVDAGIDAALERAAKARSDADEVLHRRPVISDTDPAPPPVDSERSG